MANRERIGMPGVVGAYAKARNSDPAVPFNSRKEPFKSGRGFAVDIRVRDYDGAASQRYAEGVIIGFWESEVKARKVAEDVNNGRRYGPEHQFHTRAHNAIVIPAWNASDYPEDQLPWETRQGSAEMVAAYKSACVPIPKWLLRIRARLEADAGRTMDESVASLSARVEDASDTEYVAAMRNSDSPRLSDLGVESLSDELLEMILDAVKVGEVISTLGTARPNRIVSIDSAGIRVATEKSERKVTGPQLVPAWMIVVAWDHLRQHGNLTQKQLVNELNVKRSAFIRALLSRLPNVEFDAVPRVSLRLVETVAARDEGGAEHEPSQQVSQHVDVISDREVFETEGYTGRLNRLFATVHPVDRGPYSNEEVAESLQMDGVAMHPKSISRLREGVGIPPDERVTQALAYFFNVDPDYFSDDVDADDGVASASSIGNPDSSETHFRSRASRDAPKAVVPESPPRLVGADLQVSTADLLRIIGGLSTAAQVARRRAYADLGLVRRLVSLISEAVVFLQESMSGDVVVPVRYLEHVVVEWDETEPSDNGTEPDYRWLAELLNRYVDD